MAGVSGTDREVEFSWKCTAQHVDHYDVRFWYYTSRNGWILSGSATSKARQATWNVPSNHTITKLRVRVKAVSTKHSVTTGSGTSKKTKQESWFTDEFAEKSWAVPANVKASNRELDKAAQAKRSADSARAAAERNADAAKPSLPVDTRAKYLIAAAEGFEAAAGSYREAGLAEMATYCDNASRSARATAAAIATDYCKTTLATAKLQAKSAAEYVANAANARAIFDFAAAAKSEKTAASQYTQAAAACQKVLDHGNPTEAYRQKAQSMKQEYSAAATSAASRASGDGDDQVAAYETAPAEPGGLNVAASGARFTLTFDCQAQWAAFVEVQMQVNGGNWAGCGYVAKKIGQPAASMRKAVEAAAGDKARFRIRALLADKGHPSAWVYSGTLHAKPSAPKALALKALSATAVQATWTNTGHAGESVEVQWSTWYQGGNAWAKGATAEIRTVTLAAGAQTHTITGLEPGVKLYVRVRRVSAAGSAWATLKGDAKSYTASATPPKAKAPAMAKLTALKATALADGVSVKLSFSGQVEADATCAIEHTAHRYAFDNNTQGNITSVPFTPSSASAKSHVYTVTGLAAGKTHYFRVVKSMAGTTAKATVAKGEWRLSDHVAKAVLPAVPKAALSTPTGLSSSAPYAGAVRLAFTDTPKGDQYYEIQYTANAEAFAGNAYGDIESVDFDEPAVGKAQQTYTVTGLEPGTMYRFRVRKKDAEGAGNWSIVIKRATARDASQTMDALTGLKAVLLPDNRTVKLTWSGQVESDASCTVEHHSVYGSFADNIAANITSEGYTPASATADSHTYSVAGLEQGKTHYFRVTKTRGGKYVRAKCANGAWRETDVIAAVAVPAGAAVAVPSGLAATAPRAGAIQLAFTCAASAGDAFEAQYATYPQAFTANAVGDIKSATLDEPSTSSSSQLLTVTGLEAGTTYWFRVRKKASGGAGKWSATVKCATLKASTADMAKLTGLGAELIGDGTVRLRWSGAIEAAAACTVQHTAVANAFADNIEAEITSVPFTPAQASDTEHTYSVSGLAGGTRYFRIAKSLGGSTLYAAVAAGAWRSSASVAAVEVPAPAIVSPGVPSGLVATNPRDGALRLAFTCAAAAGETFEAQLARYADAFADNAAGDITSATLGEPDLSSDSQVMTVSGLDTGCTYWARVRKASQAGAGEWSEVVQADVAAPEASSESLSAPTPTRCEPSYPTGSAALLSWTHNSAENSEQSAYELSLAVTAPDGTVTRDVLAGGAENAVELDLAGAGAGDGSTVEWCVRTAGVLAGFWSPWSASQAFAVTAPPAAGVSLTDGTGAALDGVPLSALPLTVAVGVNAGAADRPVHVRAEIVAAQAYDAEAEDGTAVHVAAGDEVWSGDLYAGDEGFDDGGATFAVRARDAVLADGASYVARARVFAASGLDGSSGDAPFDVAWGVELPQPAAALLFDGEDYTCRIFPVCWAEQDEGQPEQQAGAQEAGDIDDEIDDEADAIAALDPATGTYYPDGADDGPYYAAPADEDEEAAPLQPGVELDVYRIDMDGTAVLVAEGLPNNGRASCTDPHPNFGTLTYRIVAKSTTADVQSSSQTSIEADVRELVITYDEDWRDSDGDFGEYAGGLVRLDLSLESTEEPTVDSKVLKLAGDAYGTLYVGESGDYPVTYNAEFPLHDQATRQALRALRGRLAYVRDPLGVGFWAKVTARIGNPRPPFATTTVTCERVMAPKEA